MIIWCFTLTSFLAYQRSDIVNGVVDVEAPKGEAPEATPASEEGAETGAMLTLLPSFTRLTHCQEM